MTAFRDAVFILTLLIGSQVMSQAFNQNAFADIFGDKPVNNDPALFANGQRDCEQGLEPQSNHPSYIGGYSFQYEVEQIQGATR